MQSFSDYLVEFGDRPYPWKIITDTDDVLEASFTPTLAAGEEPYFYVVTLRGIERSKVTPGIPGPPPVWKVWEFGFALIRPKQTTHSTVGAMLTSRGYHYGGGLVGTMTQSPAIISTVANIFLAFVRQRAPRAVVFSAKEPSRQRLYQRLVQRADQHLSNYRSVRGHAGEYRLERRF